jgi:hypothetical protein
MTDMKFAPKFAFAAAHVHNPFSRLAGSRFAKRLTGVFHRVDDPAVAAPDKSKAIRQTLADPSAFEVTKYGRRRRTRHSTRTKMLVGGSAVGFVACAVWFLLI